MICEEPNVNFAVLSTLGLLDDKHDKQPETRTDKPCDTKYDQLTSEKLVQRLTNIKKRIDHLRAVFSTSLSREISRELDAWQVRFKELADVLIDHDPEALYQIVRGSEDLLLPTPKPKAKPVIDLATQRWAELVWEVRQEPAPPGRKKTFGDGLDAFV